MADAYDLAAMAALRAVLTADADLAALVGDRIVDEPADGIALPYVRFGAIEPRADDTDGRLGAVVGVGLEIHSRPLAGRVEAARICGAIAAALHRQPEALTLEGLTCSEIEVLTWTVGRAGDGVTYLGRMALDVSIDAA